MASQRFCLRWNNHQSNMLSVFDQLLHAETFTDVTLAVDGQLLKAHKMVLSACSPYFQALFVNHQEKHPIVILKDVPYADMKSLLDFMYRGEVSVDQERLTAFLKVAESLRIKGLTEVNEEKCDIPALTNSLIQQQSAHTPPPQLHRIHPYMNQKRPASGMPTGGTQPNLLMPLLGSALMQPKRKRGRPRKLSGSSSDALNTAASPPSEFAPESASHVQSNRGDQLIRGSPEMLEVKMSMDNFNDEGATSGGEDTGEALLIDEGDDAHSGETPNKDSESADYFYAYEEDIEIDNMPVITLEVLSTKETNGHDETLTQTIDSELNATKIDNIIEDTLENDDCNVKIENETSDVITQIADDGNNTIKSDHHEYMTRSDGSVVCKLCGEILQSRVHWYRHKYKLHVPLSPAELFQCDKCFVYFKSRKGYIGHFATRHADSLADYKPVLTNTQAEALKKELTATNASRTFTELKNNIDPETAIPKTTLPNHNNPAVISKFPTKLSSDQKRTSKSSNKGLENQQSKTDQDEKRTKEERLVAEIIDRVRRECEAQGAGGPARRGYSRRTTVMNT